MPDELEGKKPKKRGKAAVTIPVLDPEKVEGEPVMLVTVNADGTAKAVGDPAVSFADVPGNVHQQGLARISGAGAAAHEHFVTFGKILDYGFESDRHVVSLQQALGIREVTSQSGQLGIPNAAQQGSAAGKVG